MSTLVLGIETSCDETAAAVVEDGRKILSNVVHTQIPDHVVFGGVVPELASRKHMEYINRVTQAALDGAGLELRDLSAIAVTYGPGLVGPLLVGVSFAKGLAWASGVPLVGIHHIDGHISAAYPEHEDLRPPFVCMVASGGHSTLAVVRDYGVYEVIGQARDDAAGEAFDKVARALGLPYPGGPEISKLAALGDSMSHHFPRTRFADSLDFSFSGLKTAVLNYLNECEMKHISVNQADVAASFEQAVVDVLADHTMEAAKRYGISRVVIAGGVAANARLREEMQKRCAALGLQFYAPSVGLCTDNGAMIAAAGYYAYARGERAELSLNAVPNL